MPLALQLFQHLLGVAAVAQGGVHAHLARLDIQKVQDLVHHDGDVHAGGGLAAPDDLLHIVLILPGVQFLIFFPVRAGMGALVAHTALVLLFHTISSFKFLL